MNFVSSNSMLNSKRNMSAVEYSSTHFEMKKKATNAALVSFSSHFCFQCMYHPQAGLFLQRLNDLNNQHTRSRSKVLN